MTVHLINGCSGPERGILSVRAGTDAGSRYTRDYLSMDRFVGSLTG
jgi:hypothetical protein